MLRLHTWPLLDSQGSGCGRSAAGAPSPKRAAGGGAQLCGSTAGRCLTRAATVYISTCQPSNTTFALQANHAGSALWHASSKENMAQPADVSLEPPPCTSPPATHTHITFCMCTESLSCRLRSVACKQQRRHGNKVSREFIVHSDLIKRQREQSRCGFGP